MSFKYDVWHPFVMLCYVINILSFSRFRLFINVLHKYNFSTRTRKQTDKV